MLSVKAALKALTVCCLLPLSEARAIDQILLQDRPDFTPATETVHERELLVETEYYYGFDENHDRKVSKHSVPDQLIRLGIAEHLEVFAAWTYEFDHHEEHGQVEDTIGRADVYLGIKKQLTEHDGLLPSSSFFIHGTLPTGNEAPGHHDLQFGFAYRFLIDYGAGFVHSWQNEDWVLAGSTGVGFVDHHHDGFEVYNQSVSLSRICNDRFLILAEYYGLYSVNRDHDVDENYARFGASYLLTGHVDLSWTIATGLNEEAVDFYTGCGVIVAF